MKGGYVILDLGNIKHKINTPVVHKGIYELLKSTKKPVIVTNVVLDNVEIRDSFTIWSGVEQEKEKFLMNYGRTMIVAPNDEVTFTE